MGSREHGRAPHPNSTTKNRYSHLVRGSKVEVTSKAEGFVDSWFEATVIKPPEMPDSIFRNKRMTLVEYTNLLNDDSSLFLREHVDEAMLRPVPPGTEEDDGGFEVCNIVDAFERDGWWTGVVDRVVKGGGEEVRYVVRFADPKQQIEFGKGSLRLHLDWIDGKWFRFWNGKPQELVVKEDGRVTLAINGSHNDPKENLILNPAPPGCDPECCSGMMSSMNEHSTPSKGKPSFPLLSSYRQNTADLEFPSCSSSHSCLAKKLKRTCVDETLVHSSCKPAELSNPLSDCQNKDSGYHKMSTSQGNHNTGVRAKSSKRRAGRSKTIPITLDSGEVLKADDVQKDLSSEEKLAEAAETDLSLVKQVEAPNADSDDNNPLMQELTLVAVGTELNPNEQGHTDLVKDERISPMTKGIMAVLNEQQQPASSDVSVIRPSLPFLRISPVWEAVESLEIFQKFPQKPHFLPLADVRERFREGLAIAKMVTFASTVENAINLSVDDDVRSFTDCLETLQSLEWYGFDSKTLQSLLVKLVSLKEMKQKIDEEKNEVKGQVLELKHEIAEVREEICETRNKIKFYQDKLRSALLEEEQKDLEIFALETSLDILDTVICSAQLDFEDS